MSYQPSSVVLQNPAALLVLLAVDLTAGKSLVGDPDPVDTPVVEVRERRVTRRAGKGGRISLARFGYHVGRWLAGETVDVVVTNDGLVEISHRGVLVATHAVRHPPEAEPEVVATLASNPARQPPTVGVPVMRKVDSSGNVSFAAATYRVGNGHRPEQVEVRVVGETVEISQNGKLLRVHPVKHDPVRAHGAFAKPRR